MSHPFGDPAQKLLPLLEHVREIRAGQWRAKCPAHDGKSQDSLSIAQSADGTLLLRCWGGCTAKQIVEAIGLELKDLFPRSGLSAPERRDYARKLAHKEILHERLVLQLAAADIENGKVLSIEDRARIEVARQRIAELEGGSHE